MKSAIALILLGSLLRAACPARADQASEINAPRLISSDGTGVTVEVGVRTYSLTEVQVEGRPFRRMTVPGYATTLEPGGPAVPLTSVLLGVPEGVDVSAEILEEEATTLSDLPLAPFGDPGMRKDRHAIDESMYALPGPYPALAAEITSTGYLRHQRVAVLALRPVRYTPARRELRIDTRLRVAVRFTSRGSRKPAPLPPPGGDRAFEPVYRASLLNYESSRTWRILGPSYRPGLGKVDAEGTWIRPALAYYRFTVSEDGLYRLDREWFRGSGLDTDLLDLERVKLYQDGEQVPLRISDGADGRLDPGDFVEFYGRYRRSDRDFESHLGRPNAYFLTPDGDPGLRVTSIEATPRNGLPTLTSYRARFHFEQDGRYDPLGVAPEAPRDHWLWARIDAPDSLSLPWRMDAIDTTGGPVFLRVCLQGLTDLPDVDPDHRAILRVNNHLLQADPIWEGQREMIVERVLPLSIFKETSNALAVEVPGEIAPGKKDLRLDYVLFNYFDVAYDRMFQAIDGDLAFDLEDLDSGRRISISGVKGPGIHVYDLTRGAYLTGAEVVAAEGGLRVTFEVGPNRGGRYLVAGSGGIRTPGPAVRSTGLDLRAERTGADYLIITHRSIQDALGPFAQHRRDTGLTVKTVEVQDIFDAFGFGQFEPEAIRAYLRHAMATWSRPPSFLLLVGRETYDYRDIMKTSVKSMVPSLLFQSRLRGEAPTDYLYAAVVGDDLFPDLSVGRLSVSSPEETRGVVQKLISYDMAPPGRWRDRGLFLANNESFLQGTSDFLIQTYSEPFGLETVRIYSDDTVPEPNENTRRFIEQMNEGHVIVNFRGHGGLAAMAFFFRGTSQKGDYTYMTKLTNGEKLPLFMAMSCLNGMYAEPSLTSLAEEMVNKTDGGAIAYVSTSALGFAIEDSVLNDRMFLYTFLRNERRFGAILDLAKIDLIREFPGLDSPLLAMNLMGDPAQRLALLDGPDYEITAEGVSIHDLPVEAEPPLIEGDTVRVGLRVRNLGRTSQSGVRVSLLDRWLQKGVVDTLFSAIRPPFGQTDTITATWRLQGRAGPHMLAISLEPGDADDLDPANNTLSLPLTVYPDLAPIPLGPLDDQRLGSPEATLTVLNATQAPALYDFEVSPSPSFEGPQVRRSGHLAEGTRITSWTVSGLGPGAYFWRARAFEGDQAGRWSSARAFLVDPSPGTETWRQATPEQLLRNRLEGVDLDNGGLTRSRKKDFPNHRR